MFTVSLVVLGLLAPTISSLGVEVGDTSACQPANDFTTQLVDVVTTLMVGAEGEPLRIEFGLPAEGATVVEIVTDEATCMAAARALDTLSGATETRVTHVIRADSFYFVLDPDERAGEWMLLAIFSPAWEHITTLVT